MCLELIALLWWCCCKELLIFSCFSQKSFRAVFFPFAHCVLECHFTSSSKGLIAANCFQSKWGASTISAGPFRESPLLGYFSAWVLVDIWHLHCLPRHAISLTALPHLSNTVRTFPACTVYYSGVIHGTILCDLTRSCLCLIRFDYCRFIELDYVPMETGYMVSMRPTKGYSPTKSPTKGYTSTKSPDRHSHSTNSPATPRSRSVPSPSSSPLPISVGPLKHVNDETLWTADVSWCHIVGKIIVSTLPCQIWSFYVLLFSVFILFPACCWNDFGNLQHYCQCPEECVFMFLRQTCCLLTATLTFVFVMCLCVSVLYRHVSGPGLSLLHLYFHLQLHDGFALQLT